MKGGIESRNTLEHTFLKENKFKNREKKELFQGLRERFDVDEVVLDQFV